MKQNDNCFTLNETRIHQNCQIEDLESWSGGLNRYFCQISYNTHSLNNAIFTKLHGDLDK